ncbi:aminoglycoside phosphotransferase family protein [Actinomadura sp. KC06]|uniref:phosphotransferase family protein n=1 Tax=Actinomadura sp. KC06 TaxID=2530369 RepID=UPI00104AE95A|nr:aminoglycoside phosphotransferase family protein [Actinomadura sp. KC06]TDD38824.1 aminoglycoside phosphotransferase family protein [Actinomadura sp. KC06]
MIEPSPSAEALAWAAQAAGEPVRVVRRLPGGTHAATHLLATAETRKELVLRRFPHGDTAAANEARVLDVLGGLDGWAPQLLGADPDGHRFGEPAVLITRLPGRADIMSVAPGTAAVQLGRVLARLHGTPLTSLTGLRDGMAAALASPTRNDNAAPGAQALLAHGHRLAEAEHVLTHYDFWSGNVLWDDGALTGVIDWSGASRAPRGFDVGWCRLDLVLLHGPHTADTFTNAYQEAAGNPITDLPLWDVFALTNSHNSVETWLPNYHDLGRTDLTSEDLRKRHTAWTDQRLSHCP